MRVPDSEPEVEIAEEDELRATWYALLARLLSKPPDQAFLAVLRSFEGDESEIGAGDSRARSALGSRSGLLRRWDTSLAV